MVGCGGLVVDLCCDGRDVDGRNVRACRDVSGRRRDDRHLTGVRRHHGDFAGQRRVAAGRSTTPLGDATGVVLVAGDRDRIDGVIGDFAQQFAGDDLEDQLDRIALDCGHAVEQATEVGDLAQLHRARCQLLGGQDAVLDKAFADRRIAIAFRVVHLAVIEVGAHDRRTGQRQFAREPTSAGGVQHCPHRARARSIQLEQPTRGVCGSATGGSVVHTQSSSTTRRSALTGICRAEDVVAPLTCRPGRMPEWTNGTVSKTVEVFWASVGSNPTPSAS